MGGASEDEDVMSSSQQSVKPYKSNSGSQVVVVTKPAVVSSADSHITLVVRMLNINNGNFRMKTLANKGKGQIIIYKYGRQSGPLVKFEKFGNCEFKLL